MKSFLFIPFVIVLISCQESSPEPMPEFSNQPAADRMLLVLSAPKVSDPYYEPAFNQIVNFQVNYARSILGRDNVVVLMDEETYPYYQGRLPNDIILITDLADIWVRDFTTVNPISPVQFRYTWASVTQTQSEEIQQSFQDFADQYGIERGFSDYLLDGGNLVDNYTGRVILTRRFLTDNNLSQAEGTQILKDLLGATDVVFVTPDEPVLAHADGMLSWVAEDVLFVNDYSQWPGYRNQLLNQLSAGLPGVEIVEIPVEFVENEPGEWEGFSSACGINLNATLTFQYLYIPVFGMDHEQAVLDSLAVYSDRTVVPVEASGVCAMGGSVRCLTWQLTGDAAEQLISAAQE
jgi:agmatine/peptidylarginine deiminase